MQDGFFVSCLQTRTHAYSRVVKNIHWMTSRSALGQFFFFFFLIQVGHYFCLQHAYPAVLQDRLQCANRDEEEDECQLAYMDVNNALLFKKRHVSCHM